MPDRTVVAIHQPNFFPWLGFFKKIVHADVFILMDNVQFPKTGGTWINRVRILVGGQPAWITVPVMRAYHGTRRICEMEINNSSPWKEKMLNTMQSNYAGATFFKTVFPMLKELVNRPASLLADYNINAISALAGALELDISKFVIGSSLTANGNATDLLIEMVTAVHGTIYLCGNGAGEYQEDGKFASAGLGLLYQNFQHPVYPQFRTERFEPGLSIIDVLMNCGLEGTRDLLLKG